MQLMLVDIELVNRHCILFDPPSAFLFDPPSAFLFDPPSAFLFDLAAQFLFLRTGLLR